MKKSVAAGTGSRSRTATAARSVTSGQTKRSPGIRISAKGELPKCAPPKATTAKRRLPRVAVDEPKYGGIASAAVEAATARGWNEWLALLDRAGAAELPHKEIARLLQGKFGTNPWWSQMITVGYEQARGRRETFQKCDGQFQAGKSRVFAVSLKTLYAAWEAPALRRRWLNASSYEVTKATPLRTMRIAWNGGSTRVSVNFAAKSPSRSSVALTHEKLDNAKEVAHWKAFWESQLERLAAFLCERET